MNLNFGEHYYEGPGWFLGAIVAVSIFFLGQWFENFKEKRRLTKKNKQNIKYLIQTLRIIIEQSKRQSNYIDEYYINQEKLLVNVLVPEQIPSKHFERLLYISDNIYKSLLWLQLKSNSKLINISKFYENVDYINGVFQEIHRISESHTKETLVIQNDIKSIIDYLIDDLNGLSNLVEHDNIKFDKNKREFIYFTNHYVSLNIVLLKKKVNIKQYKEELIDKLIFDIKETYKDVPYIYNLLYKCRKAGVRINDLEEKVKKTMEEFVKIGQYLKPSIKYIEEVIKTLEKELKEN